MPKPTKNESMSEFMAKFMGDKKDRAKWGQKQRAAVGYSEWREARKKHAEKA
jgi:hypothetical protein